MMRGSEAWIEALASGTHDHQVAELVLLLQDAALYGGQCVAGHTDVILDSCLAYSDSVMVRQLCYELLRTVPHSMQIEWGSLYSEVKKDVAGNMTAEDGVEPRSSQDEAALRVFGLNYLGSLPTSCIAEFLRSERQLFDPMLLPGEPGMVESRSFPGTNPAVRMAAVVAYGSALSRPEIVKQLCSSLRDSMACAIDLFEMVLERLFDLDNQVCAVAFQTVGSLLTAHRTLHGEASSMGNTLVDSVVGWISSRYDRLLERARKLQGKARLCRLIPLVHGAARTGVVERGFLCKNLAEEMVLPELEGVSDENMIEGAKALCLLGKISGAWEPHWVTRVILSLIHI
eukprot:TRINITY_DN37370_c0_g1_i1.p1 TRINITY_DN37370_c0_g1~~TRINITY_DN37370_c0_g1_i1.p1  ORF type:complete len:343 (+),score=74.23 TRINITY_DN37370_c0_g1_i1:195-1223(+)